MKKIVFILFCLIMPASLLSQQKEMEVNGVVLRPDNQPIGNVNIIIKGSTVGVQTHKNGTFKIKVHPKDKLIFSMIGMHEKEITIKKNNQSLHVVMYPKEEILDEIVVKKKLPITQKQLLAEYPMNKSLIKTTRGIVSKDLASFSIRVIDGDELIPVGTDFLYSLQNLYPNLTVIRDDPKGIAVFLQNWSNGSKPKAIFDVDGIIHEQVPTFINVPDIDRVAILVRNGAISRYGPAGAGGVIIINTKSAAWMDEISRKKTYHNSALHDSILMVLNEKKIFAHHYPTYMEAFEGLNSKEDVDATYELLKKKHGNSPYFSLEMVKFYNEKRGDNLKALGLLDSIADDNASNAEILKITAYLYEELGKFEDALKMYVKILKLRSRSAQSHRDLANAYQTIGDYKSAFFAYTRYETAINELDSIPFDAYGTDLLMTTEASNLIKLNKKIFQLEEGNLVPILDNPPTRLLFEWSQETAVFDIQIETPDGHITTWMNSHKTSNPNLESEKLKGYSSKQFFLDEYSNEAWKININYKGPPNNSKPTFLKATVYFNYGKSTQEQISRVYKFTERHSRTFLFTVNSHLNTLSE